MHKCTERHTFPGYFRCKDVTNTDESERKSHLVGFLLGSHVPVSLCSARRRAHMYP